MHEREPSQEPNEKRQRPARIYCASLSDYNNGILHGDWIDGDADAEVMQDSIDRMLANSPTSRLGGGPAEEWAIHDYEGFGAITIREYTALSTVAIYTAGLAEHGPAYAAWIAHLGGPLEDGTDFDDVYLGEWSSAEDYAQHLLDDFGIDELLDEHIPSGLRSYVKVDVEGFARDLELGGDVVYADNPTGGIWVYQAS